MNASKTFNASDAVTLDHQLKDKDSLAEREPHSIKRFVLRFKEYFRACFAAVALNAFFVLTELFALSRTVMTSHCETLPFFGDWLIMSLRESLRAIAFDFQ